MKNIPLEEMELIGLSLKKKTINANGQSAIDCGNLWQEFENGKYKNKIPGKPADKVLAVYYQYESDHNGPFSYFIGCPVPGGIEIPQGMERLVIPAGAYQKMVAKGKMPDCIVNAWKEIWSGDMGRAYTYDFEVYDERSLDWNNAEVDIFISVNK